MYSVLYLPLPDGYYATHEKHPSIFPLTSLGVSIACVPPTRPGATRFIAEVLSSSASARPS